MDEIRLPHHVVNRIERRFTSRFAQMLEDRRRERPTSFGLGRDADAGAVFHTRRQLEEVLRQPAAHDIGADHGSVPDGAH
jgi:hypothetical protein